MRHCEHPLVIRNRDWITRHLEVGGIAPDHPQSVAASGGLRSSPLIIFAGNTNIRAQAQLTPWEMPQQHSCSNAVSMSVARAGGTPTYNTSFSQDSMILHRLKSRATATATSCYCFASDMLQANNRSRSALLQT